MGREVEDDGMRALVPTHGAPFGVSLQEAPDPRPRPHQVLVEVAHAALNFGDVNAVRSGGHTSGAVPGWDAAGVVREAAPDGSGPPVGARVVGFGPDGAWAELRAVATRELAVVPDDVDLGAAAALPVSGVTALRALQRSGTLLGRRVLVTGASGGVGRFAVQLAARAGAHVIASASRAEGLTELGASTVVGTPADAGTADVVIETVGGPQLVQAWDVLQPGGVLQSIGWTSGEPATFPPYGTVGQPKSLAAFQSGSGYGPDLSVLLGLVAAGDLVVDVGWRGSWTRFDDAAQALLDRRVAGKAVLDID